MIPKKINDAELVNILSSIDITWSWVGAQNLKKLADSSDWRQKLWKSRQATAIMWRHNTVVHDYSGTPYNGTLQESPLFLLYKPY